MSRKCSEGVGDALSLPKPLIIFCLAPPPSSLDPPTVSLPLSPPHFCPPLLSLPAADAPTHHLRWPPPPTTVTSIYRLLLPSPSALGSLHSLPMPTLHLQMQRSKIASLQRITSPQTVVSEQLMLRLLVSNPILQQATLAIVLLFHPEPALDSRIRLTFFVS